MKRALTAIIALFFAFAAMAGASPQGRTAVAILKGPSGISGAWMMDGLSRTSPDDFSFQTVASADMVVAKLLSGEIDAGVLPVNIAAKLYNAGAPLRVLAVVGNGMVKFLTNNDTIRSIADLRGATVYIAGQKATPDYVFQYLCAQNGLVANRDYTPVYSLSYPEIAAALAAGRIANAVLPEPFASQAILKNPSLRAPFDISAAWSRATGLENYPMSLFVARSDLILSSPWKVSILLDSYRASIQKTVADPESSGNLAEKLGLGVSAQAAAAAIPVSNFVFIDAQHAIPGIEALLGVFLRFDPASIGGELPDRALYAQRNP